MPFRRWPRRSAVPVRTARSAKRTIAVLLLVVAVGSIIAAVFVFRSLVTELALSTARDVVVMSVNAVVKELMTDGTADPASLVELEKNADGSVTAVTTNVAAVNALSSEILERVAEKTVENVVTVDIPMGTLFGSTLLLRSGPSIPVEVTMLSSSVAGFRSEMTGAGINQTRHQLLLDLNVDTSLLMPWRTMGTSVQTEILLAETVIVGEVPQSYLNWEN